MKTSLDLSPLLKWAGGKYSSGSVIERVIELYNPHRDRRWVEPFVGGMGATLRIMPHQALLGDINPHLINLYACVKQGLIKGLEEVGAIASKEEYLQLRTAFNDRTKYRQRYDLPPSPADAILFLALNRTCWRGVCRFNQQGGFNVPWGEYKKPKLDIRKSSNGGGIWDWCKTFCGEYCNEHFEIPARRNHLSRILDKLNLLLGGV